MGNAHFLNWWIDRLRGWLGPGPAPSPEQPPTAAPAGQPAVEPPDPVTRKLSLIIYNPSIPDHGNLKLTKVLGWNDADRLSAALISDLHEASHGYANYMIAERSEVDAFPLKQDGFTYTPKTFLSAWRSHAGFHQPDAVNYHQLLDQFDLLEKVRSGAIDEVWTISFPYAGFYESRMAGPGAFWCNAPPLPGTDQAGRRFVIMAFNYERGVGEMLESYGHRAELIMMRVYGDTPGPGNLWKRFTQYDQITPGRAEVGNIHFAPNSIKDYDWGNPRTVPSHWRAWQNFPDLSSPPQPANSRDWGRGDIRAHHLWWFSLLPHVTGQTNGIANNWWAYIVDPNLVP